MPNRVLRDWTDSYRFDGLSAEAECLFVRLIMKADDYGNFHGDARIVDSICFPLGTKNHVAKSLAELEARELVAFYHHAGRSYLTITNFSQRLRHTTRKFPDPSTSDGVNSAAFRRIPPHSAATCGKARLEVEEKRNEVETKSSSADDADGFEKFWEAYPRKVGKGAAQNSWRKAKPPIDAVLTAIRKARQSQDWQKERGAFIPHPATWLNQARWEDEGMDYAALAGKRDSEASRPHSVDESEAFRWRSERYPESLEVHPSPVTFPFAKWPDSIRSEYRNRNRTLQAA
jgi:hypothetical protein